ncbi:MAG: hypothetical protein WBA61_10960 [Aequorivita sp.]
MSGIKYNFSTVLMGLLTIAFIGCSTDDDDPAPTAITVSTSDFSITMDENPSPGQIIGSVEGSTNQGKVTFILGEQNPPGALAINNTSGELRVADEKLFDFEINPVITGNVRVYNGEVSKFAKVTITLIDVEETNVFEGNIHLKSQQEVDDFGLQQYTHVTGDLRIGEYQDSWSDIEDLTPLRNLTTLDGNLILAFNGKLISTLGLENVFKVGGDLEVARNRVLERVEGLQKITSLTGSILFLENFALENLDGLNQITNVGENVTFYDTPKLKNLDWMVNITTIGGFLSIGYTGINEVNGLSNLRSLATDLFLSHNPSLKNLDGLGNLSTNINHLNLRMNKSLTSIKGIRNINVTGRVEIYSNKLLESLDGLQGIKNPSNLSIGDTGIVNLEGLNNLTSVKGDFSVGNNWNLKSLSGLDALNNIDGIFGVHTNYFLKDFCELRDFLTNGNVGSFEATGNSFNPSKQDIIDGNCKI